MSYVRYLAQSFHPDLWHASVTSATRRTTRRWSVHQNDEKNPFEELFISKVGYGGF
jgi:hypothetical protein